MIEGGTVGVLPLKLETKLTLFWLLIMGQWE
jgi:hypothetical protein